MLAQSMLSQVCWLEYVALFYVLFFCALVAQRIERRPPKAKVVGSIPTERALLLS